MKKVVTIQDISCYGKCSLTVALPVISAMGIETCVIPTAVLSTHTGGFTGWTFRDLTDDIPAITKHWLSQKLHFDAIYTGYLGSIHQVQLVSDFFDAFGGKEQRNAIIVDPAMADFGRLYAGFTLDFVAEMRKLCARADYIIPNMTEAAFLLGIPYREQYDRAFAEDVLRRLADLGCPTPVLTGVHYDNLRQGALAFDSANNTFHEAFQEQIDCMIHGTGDIFASVFTGAITLGKPLQRAVEISVNFTVDCIRKTYPHREEMWYGSCFEPCLGRLIQYVNE